VLNDVVFRRPHNPLVQGSSPCCPTFIIANQNEDLQADPIIIHTLMQLCWPGPNKPATIDKKRLLRHSYLFKKDLSNVKIHRI
jgi:hypothetical protein